CLAPCEPPSTVSSSKKIFRHGNSGNGLFKCDSGKLLVGLIDDEAIHCVDGKWKDSEQKEIDISKVKCNKNKSFWGSIFG
uniref:hypothetical protein n=1 Tax=Salmonella sp. s54925 TaxID=3159674 RepID=UPI003980CA31